MKVIDHLASSISPIVTFEVLPPERGKTLDDLFEILDPLVKFSPPWIDITSHPSQIVYQNVKEGLVRRRTIRKRPGTIEVATAIQQHFKVDTVPHLLCNGFTREETEDALFSLRFLGIENILALQGDPLRYEKPIPPDRTRNERAIDLVRQITNTNQGTFLDNLQDPTPTDFQIGVAGYPEKHELSPNKQQELIWLKEKINVGSPYVAYIVTQMFFNNSFYFDYVKKCRALGITQPIIPGLKVLTTKSQLVSLPKMFHTEIPQDLFLEVEKAKDKDQVREIGVEWAYHQVEELLNHSDYKAPSIHLYVTNASTEREHSSVENLVKKIK